MSEWRVLEKAGGLTIDRVDPRGGEARGLIAALDAALARVYPREVIFGLHEDDFDEARLVFFVARRGGVAVACGALRSLDDETGEVKRMFVVPEERGRGISRLVLSRVEAEARARGHRRLRLETGDRQAEAVGLYRTSGFAPIEPWGEYVGNDYSVCFEKELVTTAD